MFRAIKNDVAGWTLPLQMGVKAAGGVRDLDGLKAMVAAGATRVGASAGVKIVQQSRGADVPAPAPPPAPVKSAY